MIEENPLNKSPAPVLRRRHWLAGVVAGTAALGGAGLAWWRIRPQNNQALDFWTLNFDTPEGASLRMTALRGTPLLVNFWAPWCPPCVEELPLINDFYRQNASKGWQVLGLAVDQLEPVKRFLSRAPVAFPVVLAGMPGIEVSKSLGNLTGGLPFTVVFGSDGQVTHRKIGKVTLADLQDWAGQK